MLSFSVVRSSISTRMDIRAPSISSAFRILLKFLDAIQVLRLKIPLKRYGCLRVNTTIYSSRHVVGHVSYEEVIIISEPGKSCVFVLFTNFN